MNDGSISTDLYQFLAAFFHQDWDLEAADWQGIVDNYINADPVAGPLRALAQDIDDLRQAHSETDLEQFLVYTVGMYYSPAPLPYKEWLGRVADRLRERAASIENSSTP
ncbi:hypothetical protein A5765_14285 [Mycolicibacterium celeriflavum]|nr:hypothetical protein A5765_14285 [Mycolicibacterium celeriflavum]